MSQVWSLEAISAPNVPLGTTSHAWDHPATPLLPFCWFPPSHSPCSLSAHYTQWTCVLSASSGSASADCVPVGPCTVWSWVSPALPLLSSLWFLGQPAIYPFAQVCPLRTLGLGDRLICHLLPDCWKIHRTFSLPPWG